MLFVRKLYVMSHLAHSSVEPDLWRLVGFLLAIGAKPVTLGMFTFGVSLCLLFAFHGRLALGVPFRTYLISHGEGPFPAHASWSCFMKLPLGCWSYTGASSQSGPQAPRVWYWFRVFPHLRCRTPPPSLMHLTGFHLPKRH